VYSDNTVFSFGTNFAGTLADGSEISGSNVIGDQDGENAVPMLFSFPSTIQWMPVASQGTLYDATGNVDEEEFRTIWASSPNQILHRKCLDCISSHQDIYYRRFDGVGGLPSDLDLLDTVKNNWFDHPHNSFNVDFKLYSSYVDALNDTNSWAFCNFNDPGVGFPRDCGPTSSVSFQWNSFFSGRRGELNLGFYVESLVYS
jgi:hypothetical protein